MARNSNGIFHNNYSREPHGAGRAFMEFLWDMRTMRWIRPEFPRAENDPVWLKANRTQASLTWIGHASFLLQFGGLNALTDPHLTRRTSPVSWAGPERLAPLGLDFPDLPKIDLVVISHSHYDHLDLPTVQRLAREHDPLFVVPLGLKAWFADNGMARVTELDWWQSAEHAGMKIHAVPVQHFSGRTAFDRNRTLWAGFVLESGGRKVFFAGDTGYSKDFTDIGKKFAPIDLSLIPIGAYNPRGFMRTVHVDPAEAVKIHQDIGSKFSVGMHWGTFRLTLEPLDEPPLALVAALKSADIAPERFRVMQHGETLKINWK
ncbi:MAG: MBL fold metallo-hydrolase [Pseudomonadota bacterium]